MFSNYAISKFDNRTADTPALYWNDVSVAPKNVVGVKSGAALVIQYIEMLRSINQREASLTSKIDELYSKAVQIDQTLDKTVSEDVPTLYGLMKASCELKLVPNIAPRFQNTVTGIKADIHKYGGVIVETYLADSVKSNVMGGKLDIQTPKSAQFQDYTKGFIAYSYDSKYLYLQNSLGQSWGSLGTGRITWEDLTKNIQLPEDNGTARFFIKSATFVNGLNAI